MEEIRELITKLSRSEFDSLMSWLVNEERDRRERLSTEEAIQARLIAELVQSGKITGARFVSMDEAFSGEKIPAWRDPKGEMTKAYPYGAVITRNKEVYISVLGDRLNFSEPGTDASWENRTDPVRVANLLPGEEEEVDISGEPNYFSENPAPQLLGDDELGLQDGATPTSPALNDADSEADSST